MARIGVPVARADISESPEGLIIRIPAKKNWLVILFLGFWMVGWITGESSAIHQMLRTHTSHGAVMSVQVQSGLSAFMVVWLAGWTMGGIFAAIVWLWNFAGVERIVLGPSTLAVKREIFGIGPLSEYELMSVSDLRISASPYNFNNRMSPFPMMNTGTIAFDYGPKTLRFGMGLDEAEAQQIIERMKTRHAF
ncbi:MAG TPA: hypothetical protein VHS07_05145 [Candidatus Binataceae bacterium]|jgi:hypothetical protein|nr:hypothetical protein [Candidatus Binataceae bacterium]